jgi:acetyl-CoA C-acetyltransferase
MKFDNSYIPVRHLWSSPFIRWQGSLSEISSITFAASTTREALGARSFDPKALTTLVVGQTIPQRESFYAVPYLAKEIGAPGIGGPLISQACATSVACLAAAAGLVESEPQQTVAVVTTDRISNGPLMIFPAPSAPGGSPQVLPWVLDSFAADPCTSQAMVQTAENVAKDGGLSRSQVDEMTLLRFEQYQTALQNDRAFQRRYMQPIILKGRKGEARQIEADEGVHAYTMASLSGLKPVSPDGVVTYGSQTHPADGCAGALVCTKDKARGIADSTGVAQIVAVSFARAEPARMPKAATLAAQRALSEASLRWSDIKAVTSHNPFAVNDLWFCRETGFAPEKMNSHGSSLIFGHPQGPTGLRSIAELVQELVDLGGGYGLFTGCAAGDMGGAIILRVDL